MLNHSLEYNIALAVSLLEFIFECYYLLPLSGIGGGWKFLFPSSIYVGFLICVVGDCIRKCAIFTAGKNFTHLIASEHDPEHRLVTNGIYGVWRHPSYVGWFYWSIGTQVCY